MKKRLIIDASCIISVLRREPECYEVFEKTKGYELYAPGCLPYEIGNSLSKMLKRQIISFDVAKKCLGIFNELPIKYKDVNLENAVKIAGEEFHYAYDIYYIDCALKNGFPILTFDNDLMRIAQKRGVECL